MACAQVLTDEDKLDELIRIDFDLEVEQYFQDKKINRDTVVQREHVSDLETKLKVCTCRDCLLKLLRFAFVFVFEVLTVSSAVYLHETAASRRH